MVSPHPPLAAKMSLEHMSPPLPPPTHLHPAGRKGEPEGQVPPLPSLPSLPLLPPLPTCTPLAAKVSLKRTSTPVFFK